MAKKENQSESKALTRAQKTDATRQIVRELLAVKPTKHNQLIDEVANAYVLRYGEEGENLNDVRGRVGSVLDIMKKNSEVMQDGGVYALKARMMMPPPEREEKPAPKKTRGRAKKAPETPLPETASQPKTEEKGEEPAPKKRTRAKKAPVVEEKKEEPPVEEKPAPKKRGRKAKTAPVEEEKAAPVEEPAKEKPVEEKAKIEEKPLNTPVVEEKEERTALVEKPKAELAQKSVVMDMSFLFGDKAKTAQKKAPEGKTVEKKEVAPLPAPKAETEKKQTERAPSITEKKSTPAKRTAKAAQTKVALTPDEKLKESFLKRMRTLGGDYFEYYSVYLLERYSIQNGRRLEGLRVSGGDHDGGIDGELELTDALGFKETIYIQSKNWDPEKGKEEKWVVGETLLQQFIGACACRQAKDGKVHARGIFITTSRFTPEAKQILERMADKIVGYDGNDLFETAKECQFGVVKKNGEWTLDEKLLSGTKAFFQMTV